MNYKKTSFLLTLAAAQFVSMPTALAADPLANCLDGVPFVWPNGGTNIPFNPDQGGLGPLDNAGAIEQVEASFAAWTDIASSTASYVNAGILPVDVDITNFGPYLNATAPDGLSAIVFDDTGEIFELLFGPDTGVLGFAGPEFGDPATCTITEGLSFLNGPAFVNEDDPMDFEAATDVMVHEFGHYSNLAHVQVNGGIAVALDPTGPSPDNTTFPIVFPDAFFTDDILETMYPFYFGPGLGTQTPAADDVASLSLLYPDPSFAGSTVTITGSVLAPNGTTRLSGVNVIARNLSAPFSDAVSAISGGRTDLTDSDASGVVGTFTLAGLTPGAEYAIFIDDLGVTTGAGGAFSTSALTPLPGPEEYWNGGSESADPAVDDPLTFQSVTAAAGGIVGGVDFIVNALQPGQPIDLGDDASALLFLDFPFDFCGISHDAVFINSNGSLSFVAGDPNPVESTPAFLSGPPRIAALWDDLDPSSGGIVTFEKTEDSVTVIWDQVPLYGRTEADSFTITLNVKEPSRPELGAQIGSPFHITYGDLASETGIAGYSCGANGTSGFEPETYNLGKRKRWVTNPRQPGARFEQFTANGDAKERQDLANRRLAFAGANALRDTYEPRKVTQSTGGRNNDSIDTGTRIRLPFDSSNVVTSITPDGNDIDFYLFSANAGDVIAAEVVRTHNDNLSLGLDTVIGLFNAETGELLAVDDDGGYVGTLGFAGLSRLLIQVAEDLKLALAVTTFPDLGFTGAGGIGGRYVLQVRTYPAPEFILQPPDESSVEIPLPNGFTFHGQNWDSVYVNSNGHLTFGQEDALSFIPDVFDLLNGPPRIAPLWDDFEPDGLLGGGVPGFVLVDSDARSTSIHWVSVSQFIPTGPSYFSVNLDRSGQFTFDTGATTRELGQFGSTIVGTSGGGGAADPGSVDLSQSRYFPADGTVYENFLFPGSITPSDFDLYFSEVEFGNDGE